MRFCRLYGGMEGVVVSGSSRWVSREWGRVVWFVPACQLPDCLSLLLQNVFGDVGGVGATLAVVKAEIA